MSSLRKKLLISLGSFVATIAAIEVGLGVAAAAQARKSAEHLRATVDDGRPMVAFIGDSNIYGVYVNAEETLPRAVERLSQRGGARGIRCVNLGRPGATSWVVLENQLRDVLPLKPLAVVVTCGLNNYSMVRPGAGLGPLESLRFVKAIRRAMFNRSVEQAQLEGLAVGAGGASIDGAVANTGNGTTALVMKPRDGVATPFAIVHRQGEVAFKDLAPAYGADLRQMAELAEAAGSRLVIATYLAGLEDYFKTITETMKSVAGVRDAALADNATAVQKAILDADPELRREWSYERHYGRFCQLVSRDRHPTALGYEFEARVVAKTLHDLGILPESALEDPIAVIANVPVTLPGLRRVDDEGLVFEVAAQPGDRLTLLAGAEGLSDWKNLALPYHVGIYRDLNAKGMAPITGVADAQGKARLEIPKRLHDALPKPYLVGCFIERGGGGVDGATQTFLSERAIVGAPR